MLEILNQKDNEEYIRIPYLHIHQTTQNYGSQFCQDIEPTGEYMSYVEPQYKLDISNYEYGYIRFKNPLIVEYISTGIGGWKTNLSNKYNGSVKKRLSNKIIKNGYDGIITIDSKNNEIMEIVNLKGIKEV